MKISELKIERIDVVPQEFEEGILYVSDKFQTSFHLCPCGCNEKIVIPFNHGDFTQMWDKSENDGLITLSPSIGNYYLPCRSHYRIINNKIIPA